METSKSIIKKAGKWLFALCLLWFLIETSITVYYGSRAQNPDFEPQFILVFGNKVNSDGSLSKRLQARLNEALEQSQQHPEAKLIVSGGFGKEGFFEGDKMAEYLMAKGIENQRIIIDNEGITSLASIQNFKEQFGIESKVLFVSQFYHLRRIEILADNLELSAFESVAPTYFEWRDFYSLFREFFAIYKYRDYGKLFQEKSSSSLI